MHRWQSDDGSVLLYLGSAQPSLEGHDKGGHIVTDPPYGIGYKPLRGSDGSKRHAAPVAGDDRPFDAAWLVDRAKQWGRELVLWGANNYGSTLPDHPGWLVWNKTCEHRKRGFTYSDCELAWCSAVTRVHRFDLQWGGEARDGEPPSLHPTQKPVRLMQWCLELLPSGPVVDPYMGSGTTGVAAVLAGRPFVGVELEPRYFEAARRRIEHALTGGPLFSEIPGRAP